MKKKRTLLVFWTSSRQFIKDLLKYDVWVKFSARAMTIQLAAGYIMVLIAHHINLGPF